jgi:hypothetical protein
LEEPKQASEKRTDADKQFTDPNEQPGQMYDYTEQCRLFLKDADAYKDPTQKMEVRVVYQRFSALSNPIRGYFLTFALSKKVSSSTVSPRPTISFMNYTDTNMMITYRELEILKVSQYIDRSYYITPSFRKYLRLPLQVSCRKMATFVD